MKKKTKKPESKVTIREVKRVPPMAVMKCEINFDTEKIKELMAKHGLLDKLENPDPPKELPE